ncbi:helix-turn-helix domain-containing protein [Nocardiopsis sp. FR4]|uniref:helix-turn-helix domain-containing protein n=1 Tax=Nocardiopsis sp. FR4 TaxID=2605985 RepID=UPI00135BE0FF|nr:helix-turn-helix transcriptional regulator [Nocardiopsis sp. FR4]
MTALLCGYCGKPREGGAAAYRCTCIPAEVWRSPDLAQAVRTLNLAEVIRCLRRHSATRHLSQSALASLCGLSQAMISRLEAGAHVSSISRAVTALAGLGAPGVSDGTRWRLPDDDEPLPLADPQAAPELPCVVITSPVPIHVWVRDTQDTTDVAFVSTPDGPCLVINRNIPWGVTSAPGGATAWFALTVPKRSALTASESKDPR